MAEGKSFVKVIERLHRRCDEVIGPQVTAASIYLAGEKRGVEGYIMERN